MQLGLNLGYWGGGNDADNIALAKVADELGYTCMWVAESWGSDAVSVLAWIAAQTTNIGIGSAIMQIPARSPAMTAMTAATLDTLSQGRFRLGLGLSGPQVSEGWHGVRFDKPLARQREYVEVVRKALSRQKLSYQGEHFTLPLPDGPGKALHLMIHPVREHIPVYLASVGPKNLELAGEIADGWLGIFPDVELVSEHIAHIAAGRAKAGLTLEGFDVAATLPVAVGDDLEAIAEPIKGYVALYVGGMGSREQNFYNAQARRMGFEEEAARIQDLYLGKQQQAATEAVPFALVDRTSLIGPPERIAERLQDFAKAGVTQLALAPYASTLEERKALLRTVIEAGEKAGVLS
ncbi:MAG TPA: LLM class F420-dependent oxidoreductase [Mycobacteriales bacterium]|nr:LLM class F420-dependent oxidoreductase [Mycobacteriales bacterium]